MKRIHGFTAAAAAAFAVATAMPAAAQMFGGPGGGMMGPGFGVGARMGGNGNGMGFAQAQLDLLHTQLHITAAQEPAWQAFSAAANEQARGMDNSRDSMWQGTANAADRLVLHAALMDDRANDMLAVAQAFRTLYAAMSPEQRAIADSYFMGGGIGRPSGFFR